MITFLRSSQGSERVLPTDRGVIRNREFAQQIRDFSGLRWGKITPTDIDLFIEFGDTLYVLAEGKHGNAHLPYGQRLAFQRLVDALHHPPRISIGFIVSHDCQGDIDFAALPVREYRFRGAWRTPKAPVTLVQAINMLLARKKQ